jgi:ribose 5-phosphate isomerase B
LRIALSCDHRGAELYNRVAEVIRAAGHDLIDSPTSNGASCDYPDLAWAAGTAVHQGRADRAVLICGSGIGMCIAANKVTGVRAALVHDDITAEMSRRHNDANVLCLSADMLGLRLIEKIVQIWLAAEFEGGRHARRVRKITAIEQGQDPARLETDSSKEPKPAPIMPL